MQAQGHAQGRAGVQAHANVRRPGRPAERRPDGGSARQRGRARCHAAAHLAINPAVFLADAPRVSRRFAGSRRPRIAAPLWGSSWRPGPAWPSCRCTKAPIRGSVPTRPEGPRWAVGSRTNRPQCLCTAIMPCHAWGSSSGRSVAGELYAGGVATGVVKQTGAHHCMWRTIDLQNSSSSIR